MADGGGDRGGTRTDAADAAARRQLDELESGLAHKQSYWLSHRNTP